MQDAAPKSFVDVVKSGDIAKATAIIRSPQTPAGLRWSVTHCLWSMFEEGQDKDEDGELRFSEMLARMSKYRVEDVVGQVQCPVFVGDAEEDLFWKGQARQVADALGDKATYHLFKSEDGAGEHCQVGASQVLAQTTLDWFEKVVA